MKIFVVADPYVIKNDNSIKFLELTLTEIGFDLADLEYLPSYPEELETAPEPKSLVFTCFQTEFNEYIDECQPDIILAFGNNAICTLGLVPKPSGIMKMRGKMREYHGAKLVCAISPNLVLREPVHEDDFFSDMSLAFNGSQSIDYEIIDIEDPAQIADIIAECYETGVVAYDWETTDKDPAKPTTIPVTCSWATGKKTKDGKYRGYFLHLYDKLVPRFDEATLEEFKVQLGKFFDVAGTDFELEGWNTNFDDWITEEYLGHKIFGSSRDGMIEKWSYNNIRPHGLKETVGKYLGVPDYDKEVDEHVKAIAHRRGLNLVHPDDFFVLNWLGIEPVKIEKVTKTKGTTVTYKWPETVDKKFAAYAMLERDILRTYNVLDSIYTRIQCAWLRPRIEEDGLQVSCDFRHRIGKEILRAEQRGLPLNLEVNRKFDVELEELDKQTYNQLQDLAAEIARNDPATFPDGLVGEFNPNSSDQVGALLFGNVEKVPLIERRPIYRVYKKEAVDKMIDKIEKLVYGDFKDVKDLMRAGEFDYEMAKEFLDEEFRRLSKDYNIELTFTDKLLGLGGAGYDPVSVSKKTQRAGSGKVSLLLMQDQHETDFINLILMYRKVTKLRSTFIKKLFNTVDRFGMTRTHYNIVGTDSARISSSGNYNAQNFPKYIRGQIEARPGYMLLSCDLKAVEVRVLAAYCQDEGLLKAIYAEDTHRATASIIFGVNLAEVTDDQRKSGKIVVFLTLYGGGAEKLAKFLGKTISEAQGIIDKFLARFPEIANFIKKQHKSAREAPYYVYTSWGTRRSVKNILSNDREIVSKFERISVNSIIQGSAGELTLYYAAEFMDACREQGWNSFYEDDNLINFVITVHDEITFEVHESICWKINERYETNKKGEQVYKYDIAGPAWDLFNQVVSRTVPYPPLDSVRFDFEAELVKCWAGGPNLHKALESSSNPDEKFLWELLTGATKTFKTEEESEVADEFSEFNEPNIE